jgi:hypothetical protein
MPMQVPLKNFVPILKSSHLVLCREIVVFYCKNRKKRKHVMQATLWEFLLKMYEI